MPQPLRQRLEDPAYRDAHLCAAFVLTQEKRFAWYDSAFLRRFVAARRFLEVHSPGEVARFVAAFAPLQPPPDFAPIKLSGLFDEAQHRALREEVFALQPEQLETHELEHFGRHVVHDHPPFLALQRAILPRVNALVGGELALGYNFLSLYNAAGRCAPHMDQPISMYTLDYCIAQNVDWPIHFSGLVDWRDGSHRPHAPEEVLNDPSVTFTPYELTANDALLFCGSSQWHYREAMPEGGYSHLLFFHFYPAGCEALVDPEQWPVHFDLPQLQALLDLLDDPQADAG